MSIIAGGTRALMELLARRKLEERQQMLDALTMADKQRGWEQDRLRTEQGSRALDLTEKNQQLLREEGRAQQKRLEKADRTRVLTNVAQRMQPAASGVDPRLAQELEEEGLATGLIERKPGLSMPMPDRPAPAEPAPGQIAPLPMSLGRAPVKVTPDAIASLGGTDYQMARKAAEERGEQYKLVQAQADKAREDAQQHQKDLAGSRADTQLLIAGMGAANRQILTASQKANITGQLRDDFTRDTAKFADQAASYNELKAVLGTGSAAGDLAAVFRFMKSNDPGSTVRESEQESARAATSLLGRIQQYASRLQTGESLTTEQRADFLSVSKRLYDVSKSTYHKRVNEYTADAKSYEIDPARIIRDRLVDTESAPAGGSDLVITGIRPKGK